MLSHAGFCTDYAAAFYMAHPDEWSELNQYFKTWLEVIGDDELLTEKLIQDINTHTRYFDGTSHTQWQVSRYEYG